MIVDAADPQLRSKVALEGIRSAFAFLAGLTLLVSGMLMTDPYAGGLLIVCGSLFLWNARYEVIIELRCTHEAILDDMPDHIIQAVQMKVIRLKRVDSL